MAKILYQKGSKIFYKFPHNTFDGRFLKGDVVRVINKVPDMWNNRYVLINDNGKPKTFVASKKRDTLVYFFSSLNGRPIIKTGDIHIIGFLSSKLWKGNYK